ncbi:MAG: UvrB/UvrC motif-containing protein [Pelagibacterales bacterium]|nr:UvrB/UvrC motif-containing protein [Pelagibacterales bacterium]
MTEKQYQILLNRIKKDLYNEFINPETAHYGMKYIDEAENNDVIYEGILSEREILQEELARLCALQNKYIENEEYEKAEILKNRIIKLQNKIDKL